MNAYKCEYINEALARNSDVDLYVAFNNIMAGELQGRYLTEKVPNGNYIILSRIPHVGYTERVIEFIQPLVNIGNIKIVADRTIIKGCPLIGHPFCYI